MSIRLIKKMGVLAEFSVIIVFRTKGVGGGTNFEFCILSGTGNLLGQRELWWDSWTATGDQ